MHSHGYSRSFGPAECASRLPTVAVGPVVRRGPTRFARGTAARLSETPRSARRLAMRGEGFEPSRDVPGRSLQSLPGLRLAGFESSDCTGFTRVRGASRALRTAHARERGEGFEPKPDVLARYARCARLAGFEPSVHSHGYSRSFEPASVSHGSLRSPFDSSRRLASLGVSLCEGRDSNPRTPTGADLKSAAFVLTRPPSRALQTFDGSSYTDFGRATPRRSPIADICSLRFR